MIRIILAFLFVFGLYYFGILAWRHSTGKEQWRVVKLVSYSLGCAVLTILTLAAFVYTF